MNNNKYKNKLKLNEGRNTRIVLVNTISEHLKLEAASFSILSRAGLGAQSQV